MTETARTSAVQWWDTHQIGLYLLALVAGAGVGLAFPSAAPTFEHTINPVLIVLLYATFLAVPFAAIRSAGPYGTPGSSLRWSS